VLQYADNRSLRETLYRAFAVRASEFGKPACDNTALIRRILELRLEAARLLGYRNFAEVSLVPKMARTPGEVLAFLRDLAAKARPYAERDLAELRALAKAELGLVDLAAWDIPYASEKLRQAGYSYSDQEVKQYFPEDRVLAGMFRAVETVFGIRVRESKAPAWHPTVRFFDVVDGAGALLGQFYLDLYARPHKRGGAWMGHAINRRRYGTRVQHPVAYLTCNFPAPVAQDGKLRPALFTRDEVQTLFHEFGHGLHLLLTRVDVPGVSGLEGVEWDAVELPSQFMENFCWEWDVLRQMTAHVETGAPLPRALSCTSISTRPGTRLRSSWPAPSGAKSRSCRDPITIARPTRSATSSPADTRRDITVTSGRRCSLLTPTACSRKTACSPPTRARDSAMRSWRRAGVDPRSSLLSPFAAGRPKSMRY
jgi:oligopeptidase A